MSLTNVYQSNHRVMLQSNWLLCDTQATMGYMELAWCNRKKTFCWCYLLMHHCCRHSLALAGNHSGPPWISNYLNSLSSSAPVMHHSFNALLMTKRPRPAIMMMHHLCWWAVMHYHVIDHNASLKWAVMLWFTMPWTVMPSLVLIRPSYHAVGLVFWGPVARLKKDCN